MAEFERNTTGFTADVEMYDDGTLAKIYRDEIPDEDVQREILCTEFVQNNWTYRNTAEPSHIMESVRYCLSISAARVR